MLCSQKKLLLISLDEKSALLAGKLTILLEEKVDDLTRRNGWMYKRKKNQNWSAGLRGRSSPGR